VTPAFTLATFNVKDLFDATDEAGRAHLDAKLANLAGFLEQADADLVALQEVGSLDVARALCARAPRLGYGEPILGTADARGIRCAVIGRAPILASQVHTADCLSFPAFAEGDPPPFGARIPLRRGIVRVRIDARGVGPVDLLVGHFKSNRPVPFKDARGELIAPTTARSYAEGHMRSLVWRAAEALFVRGLVDDLLAADPARHVVVAGDINDHPASHVVRIVCGGGPDALLPCADAVPEPARFSILRRGERQQIDHVFATPALRGRLRSARFLNEALRDHGEFGDDTVPLPDSDHAALVVSFA
jgi:endonuclease/exonuclease/phosphatase family metal-dependent hydrolase